MDKSERKSKENELMGSAKVQLHSENYIQRKIIVMMKLGSKTVTRKHTNYLSGIQAILPEAGSARDELDVLDQLASRTSGIQAENLCRAT